MIAGMPVASYAAINPVNIRRGETMVVVSGLRWWCIQGHPLLSGNDDRQPLAGGDISFPSVFFLITVTPRPRPGSSPETAPRSVDSRFTS